MGWSGLTNADDQIVLVVPVFSFGGNPHKARKGDIPVKDCATCGLDPDSFVRARRLLALNPSAIDFRGSLIGTLDQDTLGLAITELLTLWTVKGTTTIRI